ncbi:MAG: V-type ATPase 116kDa subunit family protein [Candidatus Nitrosocaldus sp.]
MPLVKLLKVSLILPRREAADAINRLAELEWFHPINKESHYTNPDIDDLLLEASRLLQSIEDVVKSLNIQLETGVLDTMFKGAPNVRTQLVISDLEDLIKDLEARSKPIIEEARSLLNEYNRISKVLEEYKGIREVLRTASNIQMNIGIMSMLKRFYSSIFIVNKNDVAEIERSLEGAYIRVIGSTELNSALLVITTREDADRVVKVFRTFDVHPFAIPKGLSQNPSEAYAQVEKGIAEYEKKKEEMEQATEKFKMNVIPTMLSLHEGTRAAKEILETMRKPAGTKNFALIEGYIPTSMENRFRELSKDWVCMVEEVDEDNPESPVLMQNPTYMKTFEVITSQQGIPVRKENDPTPIVAFVWPVFYGLMFADFGQGFLLFLLGMLLRVRGVGSIRSWGTLLAASGLGATIAGLITGEMFGWHIDKFAIFEPLLHTQLGYIIGVLDVSELSIEQVLKVLEISVAIGVAHLVSAFILRIIKGFREGKRFESITVHIPSLIGYLSVVALILSAIGAGYDVIGMFSLTGIKHEEPVPWITPILGDWARVEIVADAAVTALIASMVIQLIGHMVEARRHAHHHHGGGEDSGMIGAVMEAFFIRPLEWLSHTISYSRLGIMLIVHVALMVTINSAYIQFESQGNIGGGIAVLAGGNLGVMMLEGLIVYIQAIRLHLYEWFPKWYSGEGTEFRKIVPRMLYTIFIWEGRDKVMQRDGQKQRKGVTTTTSSTSTTTAS